MIIACHAAADGYTWVYWACGKIEHFQENGKRDLTKHRTPPRLLS